MHSSAHVPISVSVSVSVSLDAVAMETLVGGTPGTRFLLLAATFRVSVGFGSYPSRYDPGWPTKLMERMTDRLTRSSQHFSTDTINVRLSSPEVPELTVVDLPGIIRTSTAGQDPAVIAQVTQRRNQVGLRGHVLEATLSDDDWAGILRYDTWRGFVGVLTGSCVLLGG